MANRLIKRREQSRLFFQPLKLKTMILTFGKFKGRQLEDTPQWYQNWLNKQDWFTMERGAVYTPRISHKQLNGWDGYGRKGEAIYNQLFEQEMEEENRMYCDCGNQKDPNEKFCGYGCRAELGLC